MATASTVSKEMLLSIREQIEVNGKEAKAWEIREALASLQPPVFADETTIRMAFVEMNKPLKVSSLRMKAQDPKQLKYNKDQAMEMLKNHAKKHGAEMTKQLMMKFNVKEFADLPADCTEIYLHAESEYTGNPIPKEAKPQSKPMDIVAKILSVPDHLKQYIPHADNFKTYIERPIDRRLAVHYDSSRPGNWKYPLSQGPQGTGKTQGHMYYAYKKQLPFYLFCAHEEFKLHKLFGEKTITNGNVVFKEGLLTQAVQHPGVILIDEVNYVSNENSVDFHAFLQNRELFVKDADNGNGKVYKLHDECRVGFAQNPKSAKYIGGNIKPSNFLGRCTYLTYPQFAKPDVKKALGLRFPNLVSEDISYFTEFFFACTDAIDKSNIPVDISIRQLNNVIDLYSHGMSLKEAVEDGLASIMEAASQPKNKEAFMKLTEAVWKGDISKKYITS